MRRLLSTMGLQHFFRTFHLADHRWDTPGSQPLNDQLGDLLLGDANG